jgi:hypothetical protein
VFDHGTIGEFGLDLLLQQEAGGLASDRIRAATTGWTGDRYTAWSSGDRFCVRDRLALDNADDTATLVAALRKVAAGRSGVTVDAGDQPVLTSCN